MATAELPYTAFPGPNLNEASLTLQDAARKRTAGQDEARQEQNSVRAPFLNTGRIGLHYLHCITVGEVAGAWGKLRETVAALTHVVHFLEPSVTRNLEAASRFEQA